MKSPVERVALSLWLGAVSALGLVCVWFVCRLSTELTGEPSAWSLALEQVQRSVK